MSKTTTCTPEALLEEFAKLSPEDQEKVRAQLGKGSSPDQAGPSCDPTAMMDQMMGMMKSKGVGLMAMCKQMMGKKQPGDRSAAACRAGKEDRD